MVKNISPVNPSLLHSTDITPEPLGLETMNVPPADASPKPAPASADLSGMPPYTSHESSASTLSPQEEPPLETLGYREEVQVRGSDPYTKCYMNRLATGQATDAEIAMFNEQVFHGYVAQGRPHKNPNLASTPSSPIASHADAVRNRPFTDYNTPLDASRLHLPHNAPVQYNLPSALSIAQLNSMANASVANTAKVTSASVSPFDPAHMQPGEPAMESPADYCMKFMSEHSQRELAVRSKTPSANPTVHPLTLPQPKPLRDSSATHLKKATRDNAAKYTKPFCDFLTNNPTVFHAVDAMKTQLKDAGFSELSEREKWSLSPSKSYFVERNGSSLIAFTVGALYKPGNGAAILAGHIDALTAKVKPTSGVPNKAGYVQLGVAPYAGAMNSTWWDRDLGIGGRVLVAEGDKIVTKLVKLDWPIARIPTLAPHFGRASLPPFDLETQTVPIIGLESSNTLVGDSSTNTMEPFSQPPLIDESFARKQPPALVSAICNALGISASDAGSIVNWELELFDVQPATVGGLSKEFIFAGRIDDKLCSWAALQALIEGKDTATDDSSQIKVVGLFDDEEIGSQLRQGARGNFLPSTLERVVGALSHKNSANLMGRTYANSFIVSSDVTHAVNPNFLGAYLEGHAPHLNVGIAIAADANGHMTTDAVSTAIFKRCADKVKAKLQIFQIRNGTPSGGTVGPMLSSMTGIRAIDAGIPQLSMHSIRATTGALDPGLGVLMFSAFLHAFEDVDKEFQS